MTTAVATRPKGKQLAKAKARTKTLVVNFVLDETGSMSSCQDATISGFNEYVDELRKRKEPILFTLTKFNSNNVEVVQAGVPIKDVVTLNLGNYQPAAMTPLYDAIARTIKATEQAMTSLRGKPNVLCVIMTDGLENASREYNRERIFALIKEKEADGWTFAYLGANQDAYGVGASIGVPTGNSMNYTADPAGTRQAMRGVAVSSAAYAASGGVQTDSFFDKRS